MAERDELILKFREVRDYRASWISGKLLKIELFIGRLEDFGLFEKELTESIQEYVFGKLGAPIELRICEASSAIPKSLANSMTKRIINTI